MLQNQKKTKYHQKSLNRRQKSDTFTLSVLVLLIYIGDIRKYDGDEVNFYCYLNSEILQFVRLENLKSDLKIFEKKGAKALYGQ